MKQDVKAINKIHLGVFNLNINDEYISFQIIKIKSTVLTSIFLVVGGKSFLSPFMTFPNCLTLVLLFENF